MKISNATLKRLIEEAIVDAYNESEQRVGLLTIIDLPFTTGVLGVEISVERVDITRNDEIVAICRRGRTRQAITILELSLPKPPRRAPNGSRHIGAGWAPDKEGA